VLTGELTTHREEQWVVAAGARDSYQLPIALHEADLLRAFLTDFYAPLDCRAAGFVCSLLPRTLADKFKRRYSSELPSRLVTSRPGVFLKTRNHAQWMEYNQMLGERAGEVAANYGCGIVSYAHVATGAFEKAAGLPKVLVQMQPHPASVRNTLREDELLPDLQEGETTNELRWPQSVFDTLCHEPQLADRSIVASNYTRRTLMAGGIDDESITVVPYGVDLDFFTPGSPNMGAFRLLFVGQPVRQKGLHYLLEAWNRLKLPNAELHVVARSGRSNAVLSRYSDKFIFHEDLDWTSLREEYRRADLVCLPSLSEGFGLVTLESLACGTPVLASDAAGSSELLEQGQDGFVIPAADLPSLVVALESAYSDRPRLREMRAAARRKAERFPWSRFREGIRVAVGRAVLTATS